MREHRVLFYNLYEIRSVNLTPSLGATHVTLPVNYYHDIMHSEFLCITCMTSVVLCSSSSLTLKQYI